MYYLQVDNRLKSLPALKKFLERNPEPSEFVSAEAITATKREVENLENALQFVADDYYSAALRYRYFEKKSDEYAAEALNCDVSTIRRNRKRLLETIGLVLYGAKFLTSDKAEDTDLLNEVNQHAVN